MRDRVVRWLIERGGLVFIASLALYVAMASPHVVDGDNSEFATLSDIGGTAHPSGYPAYVLWLRAMSWLPGSAAHASALATAILGALGAWVAYLACRAWGARVLPAMLAVGLYATGPAVLRIATSAEVFAMNQLVAATVLWLAATRGPLRGAWRIAALGLVAGLGLADQVSCVLVAPVGILGVVRGIRESRLPWLASIAIAVTSLVVGLTPYLYLFVAPDSMAAWGPVRTWSQLLAHILREDYGGPGAFSPHGVYVPISVNLGALAATLGRAWLWLPALAGIGWLGVRCARPSGGETREAWAMLALSFVLAGPVLVARFNVEPVGIGLYLCRRFHLLPAILLAPAVACALDAALARLPSGRELATRVIAVALILTAAAISLPEVAAVHSPANEVGTRNALVSLPPDAVVIETDGALHYGFAYLELTEGVRPDVAVVTWRMMPFPWYRDRLARRGVAIPSGEGAASVRVASSILASGRSVFVDGFEAAILKELPSYPYGILFRVLPAGTPRPSIDEVFEINKQLFDGFELDYATPGPDDEFATRMHDRYVQTWSIIAEGLQATHGAEAARAALLYVQRYEPVP